MSSSAADATDTALTFEDALARLERIVAEMEGGRLSLDLSMARFEEGMRCARFCAERLGEAEKKIEVLLRDADGAAQWRTFTPAPAAPPDAAPR